MSEGGNNVSRCIYSKYVNNMENSIYYTHIDIRTYTHMQINHIDGVCTCTYKILVDWCTSQSARILRGRVHLFSCVFVVLFLTK